MQGAPKLRVAILGGGLAGLSTAVELLDQVSRRLD
jgi:zeta-carotene desaturase